jgi:hypothetical protein
MSAGPYPAEISATKAIGLLTARHPMLAIDLRVASWTCIVDDVLENRIDLGFADISEAAQDPELERSWLELRNCASFAEQAIHLLAKRASSSKT